MMSRIRLMDVSVPVYPASWVGAQHPNCDTIPCYKWNMTIVARQYLNTATAIYMTIQEETPNLLFGTN